MKYLWTNKEINVGDYALLVYGAEDLDKCKDQVISDMKIIPVWISGYDEYKKEWWINLYTIKDKKFVRLEKGPDKINCLVVKDKSRMMYRLIPFDWKKKGINEFYKD